MCFGADGFDQFSVETVSAPGFGGDVEEFVVVVGRGSAGPAVAAEVVPEVFDAMDFRAVRWQQDQRDVGGDLQIVSTMEARSVSDQSRVDVGGRSAEVHLLIVVFDAKQNVQILSLSRICSETLKIAPHATNDNARLSRRKPGVMS